MNKQLLTTLCATAFSGMIFATETPDYTFLRQELHEYCSAYNTQGCLDTAAMVKTIHAAMQTRENDSAEPTQEEKDQLETLKIALEEEFNQFNTRKKNLLESAQQKAEKEAQDLSETLNPTDSTDSKE